MAAIRVDNVTSSTEEALIIKSSHMESMCNK